MSAKPNPDTQSVSNCPTRACSAAGSTCADVIGTTGGSTPSARALQHLHDAGLERLQAAVARDGAFRRVARDFSQQHQADQKLPDKEREGYTLVLAMRSWEFAAFSQLRR